MRINRYLASAGFGSRRAVEELVRLRRVAIDGETVTELATTVPPEAEVTVDGKPARPARHAVYFMMNKPAEYLVSQSDPQGRRLAIDLIRPIFSGHLFSVGRLDYLSTGLLIFTNDGDLARDLMHPRYQIEREYVVETRRPCEDSVLETFTNGITIEGEHYRCLRCQRLSARRIRVVLAEGKNREIRRVFQFLHAPVVRVHRVRFGNLRLGELPEGLVRPLNEAEILALQALVAAVPKRRPAPPRTTLPRPGSTPPLPPSSRPASRRPPSPRSDHRDGSRSGSRPPQRKDGHDANRHKPGKPTGHRGKPHPGDRRGRRD